jgi:hypothetical protein
MKILKPEPRKNAWIAILTVGLMAIFVGCHQGSMESDVSGTVSLDGKKIGPGTIVFSPATPGSKPATGSVESDGSYSLKTSRAAGLASGEYRVAVSIRQMPQNVQRGDRPPPGKLLIPEKYEDENTSGLKYQVTPGSNTINVELVSH